MKDNYIYKNKQVAEQRQKERALKRFNEIATENAYFLTFTFNDVTLKKTNEKTRERYIKDYLNQHAKTYILNRDYGKETEREHYHAIAQPKSKIFIANLYKYGYLKIKPLYTLARFKNTMSKTTAQKLYEHATKESTKQSKLIYSRQLKINQFYKYKGLENDIIKSFKETPTAKEKLKQIKESKSRQ